MDIFDVKDKVVVVTGGSRGIGKAIALGFGEAGARVVVAARKVDLLQEVAEEIRGYGSDALAVECDLFKDTDLFNLISKTVDQFGRLDILVNNAAISPYVKKSQEIEIEEWNKVIRVNLTSPFLLCREAGKIMIQNNWGRIINVASIGGLVALPRQLTYSVCKGGLIQLTKGLAIEWSRRYNITVNAIAPGYTITDLTEGMRASEVISTNLLERTPMRRFGESREMVTAALYFASEHSSFTTGAVLIIDGGWLAA